MFSCVDIQLLKLDKLSKPRWKFGDVAVAEVQYAQMRKVGEVFWQIDSFRAAKVQFFKLLEGLIYSLMPQASSLFLEISRSILIDEWFNKSSGIWVSVK